LRPTALKWLTLIGETFGMIFLSALVLLQRRGAPLEGLGPGLLSKILFLGVVVLLGFVEGRSWKRFSRKEDSIDAG